MRYTNITGPVYSIPNKTGIDFNPNYNLLHAPNLSIVYKENETGFEGIMSVPKRRTDEAHEIVEHGEIIEEEKTIELLLIDDYFNVVEEYNREVIYDTDTYLYKNKDESVIFRFLTRELKDDLCGDSYDDTVIIELLDGGNVIIENKKLKEYIDNGHIYHVMTLDKKTRGIYNDSEKDPYWEK